VRGGAACARTVCDHNTPLFLLRLDFLARPPQMASFSPHLTTCVKLLNNVCVCLMPSGLTDVRFEA
jgi:hypothetical protein